MCFYLYERKSWIPARLTKKSLLCLPLLREGYILHAVLFWGVYLPLVLFILFYRLTRLCVQVKMSIEEYLDVMAAPGRMDDMRHAEAAYNFLEVLLRHYKTDAEAEALCKGLHELGFWVCLPHVVIERAYSDRNIPDRYCTVALMAENRHLIKSNEALAEQVESLTEALRAETVARSGAPGGAY